MKKNTQHKLYSMFNLSVLSMFSQAILKPFLNMGLFLYSMLAQERLNHFFPRYF